MGHRDTTIDTIDMDPGQGGHFGSVLDVLYQNRGMIFAITSFFVIIGGVYALLAAPVYQADLTIQVEENPNTAKDVLNDVSSMFAVKTAASAEIEVLRSRMVLARAVDSTNLTISAAPRYFPVVGKWISSRLNDLNYSGLGGYAWGNESIAVSTFDVPDQLQGALFNLKLLAGGRYTLTQKDMKFSGRTGELMQAETPYGPVNLLVRQIIGKPGASYVLVRSTQLAAISNLQQRLAILERGKESDVIGVALEGTDPRKISEILNAIGNEYIRQNVQRTQEEAQNSIAFLEQQLPELKAKLESAESQFNVFRAAHGTVDLNAEASSLLARSSQAQSRLADLRVQRAQLMARFTPDNPAVMAVDDQIGQAEKEVVDISALTRQLPPLEQNLLRLQREVQVDTNIYTNLLNTQEQLRLVKAGKVSNVRLIDSAAVPEYPIRPQRGIVVVAALLSGLFVSVAMVLMKRKLVDGVSVTDEIEASTGLAVYATVPRSKAQGTLARRLADNRRSDLVLARISSFDAAVESLRSFRSALEVALVDAPNRIVLLAGPTPVVGKSFVSANLAALIGAQGQRVLLIDADLRRGSLHRYLGADCRPGVSDIVAAYRHFEDVVHRDIMPGVDFVANGGCIANASEILRHPNFLSFVQQADREYDVVLIDSPPILPVADAGVIATIAGTVFIVARYGTTTVSELRDSVRKFERIGVQIRGVIFNDTVGRPGKYGKEYGAYGYGSFENDTAFGK